MLPSWHAEEWIVAATLATAVFTGAAVLIGAFAYYQNRVDTARARPIRLRAIRETKELTTVRDNWKQMYYVHEKAVRTISVHLYNRSGIPQHLTVTSFSILWPRESRWALFDQGQSFTVEPYDGGNIVLRVLHLEWSRLLGDEIVKAQRGESRLPYLCRIRFGSVSGQSYSITRWLTFYDYRHEGGIRIDAAPPENSGPEPEQQEPLDAHEP